MGFKDQRDRFMAFSFAAADLLIETDEAGAITFALGASSGLGVGESRGLGARPLRSLFSDADAALVDHLLGSIRPGRRFGPVVVKPAGGGSAVMLSACTLPGAETRRFFTVTYDAPASPPVADAPRDAETNLVTSETFEDVARDSIGRMRAAGRDVRLTMLSMSNQSDLLARLDPEQSSALRGQIGAILRSASIGDAASELSEGRYGVIHDADTDAAGLSNDIVEASRSVDPSGEGLTVESQSLTVEEDLSSDDAARALVYTLNAFSSGTTESLDFANMRSAIDTMVKETGARIVEFKRAIAENRVSFVAQPVVLLKNGAISHYELLARFEEGASPFEVVSFAEKTGIIAEFDIATVSTAIDFLSRKAPKGFPGLAVNLSGLSIVNPVFQNQLAVRLKAAQFPRQRLSFEITESSEISDLPAADVAIRKLRAMGHHVCLDDFGAGAASFPYLRALDVDGVKIDGDYVRQALSNKRDAHLLRAMAGLCRDLDVVTIAEMVETQQHVDHLLKLGVDKGQGWLFGRPTPLDKLAARSAA